MLKTALIVDDSRLARLTLKRLLAKYDIEVAEAESVVDGENWIARHTLPDIVFMDIMMPDIDGYEGLACAPTPTPTTCRSSCTPATSPKKPANARATPEPPATCPTPPTPAAWTTCSPRCATASVLLQRRNPYTSRRPHRSPLPRRLSHR